MNKQYDPDMKNSIFFITISLLLISCKKEIKTNLAPPPLKIYQKEGIVVKSYTFDTFEHYLKKDTDTLYVVNFWATWCMPCVEELPYFEEITEKYQDKKVKVILVSLDMPKKVESNLLPFIKQRQLKSEIIYLNDPNANAWIEKVDTTWSGAIPATLIYKGTQRQFYEQSFTYQELEEAMKPFFD